MKRMLCGWLSLMLFVMTSSSALLAVDSGKNVAATSAKDVELKTQMKTFIGQAANSGDLWTAIMAESFAMTKLGARPSGLLTDCRIVGDPLFAFPNSISSVHQQGDTLVVVSGARIFRVAADGHPLGLSIPLKFTPNMSAISRDGRFLGVVELLHSPDHQLKMSVINLMEGKEMFTDTVSVAKSDYFSGVPQIAEDGTAMAVSVANDDGDVCLYGVRSVGKQLAVKGYYRPVCVGSGGAWAVAEPVSNRKSDGRVWTLLAAKDVTTLLACTAGPGVAAAISKEDPTQVQIIQSNGTMIPLPLDLPLERRPRLGTAGDCLVISTGWPSKSTSTLDLLGNPIDAPAIPTTLLFRWGDLAKSTATANPALTSPGCFGVGLLTGTSVFVGARTELSVIDVRPPNLVAAPLMTVPSDIEELEGVAGRLMLWLNNNQRIVASEDGKTLFQGQVNSAHVHDAWFMEVRREGREVDWVRLAEKPEDRLSIRLKLENPGSYWFRMDRYHRHLFATSDKKDWYDFDPLTGKLLNDSKQGKLPDVDRAETDHVGMLVSQVGRLVPRLQPPSLPPGDDSTVRWNPLDAWRVGKSLIVLDRHGQVYVAPPKRGPFQMIGSVNFSRRLALSDDGDVVMVDGDDKIVGNLAPGPLLAAVGPLIGKGAADFPEGPWRVKNSFYIPPHGKSMMWDSLKCGFTPNRLRSPATGELLVITASLVLEVGPDLGSKVGTPDREGARDIKR